MLIRGVDEGRVYGRGGEERWRISGGNRGRAAPEAKGTPERMGWFGRMRMPGRNRLSTGKIRRKIPKIIGRKGL